MTARAVPLVQQKGGVYECSADGLALLRSFKEPVAVVAVAGRYRSGKSFLINRGVLRLPPAQGFATGSTVNACTKGIWLYPTLLRRGRVPAVVLDTEGTNSMEASPEQDAKLLSIAVSMASMFVFNSSGALDEASLSEMAVVTYATRGLQREAREHWTPPCLLWTLRDFALQLEDPQGQAISPNEYMESCMSEPDKGEARVLLKEHFTNRSLVPLVRPVATEAMLRQLNSLPNSELRPEFVQQLDAFSALLDDKLVVKSIAGRPATGDVIAHLCMQAVDALNRGAVPCIADSFTFMLESQLQAELQAASAAVAASAAALASEIPCSPERLCVRRPPVPTDLASFAAIAAKFSDSVEVACLEADAALAQRNALARKRWLQEFLEAAARERRPEGFTRFLHEARHKLGLEQAYDAAALVFEACVEDLRAQAGSLDQSLQASRATEASALAASREQLGVAEALREELEEVLVREVSRGASSEHAGLIEIHEAHSAALADELCESTATSHARTRELLQATADISALREEALARGSSTATAAETMEIRLCAAEREVREAAQGLREALGQQEEAERCRLASVRTEMLEHVEEAQRRSRALLAREGDEATEALQRAERDERRREDAERRQQAAELACAQTRDECTEQLAAARRLNTEALSEKTRIMREAHDQTLSELRRIREKAAESDRKGLRLQIENDANKRSLSAHDDDLQQLAKMRRHVECLRDRLSDKDSAARASAALLDDHRKRLARMEEHARDVEATQATNVRERDYRIAVLEVQLSAAQT